jgi:aldose 1-epimerase
MTMYYGERGEPRTIRLASEHLALDVCTLGASIARLEVPDRLGVMANVALASPDWRTHLSSGAYFGDVVGPFANRIASGRFSIGERTYAMPPNDRGNLLHGGPAGMHRWNWTVATESPSSVRLEIVWADPEGHYPGPISASATYTVEGRRVTLLVSATCPEAVPLNIISHAYFNLAGARPGATILDHTLQVNAGHYLPIDATGLPSAPTDVAGTPFDLREPHRLAERVASDHPQIRGNGGFDHAFVTSGIGMTEQAVLRDLASGRMLTIESNQPALQIFTAGGFDGIESAVAGPATAFAGIAVEAEAFPDAPNHPDFPSTVILPGREYRNVTRWTFGPVQVDALA